jgi:hypothetical protein
MKDEKRNFVRGWEGEEIEAPGLPYNIISYLVPSKTFLRVPSRILTADK